MATPTSKLLMAVRRRRNLEAAWKVIQENGRTSKSREVRVDIDAFAVDASRNIDRLYRSLHQGNFKFPPAKGIAIPKAGRDGKPASIRPIVLAETRSRIVQRAVLDVLTSLPALDRYLCNPHSFGGIRKNNSSELSAVPAAIAAVLREIGSGAKFVMYADISSFFSRIPKNVVTAIIGDATNDPSFMKLFEMAIHVELANMAQLREHIVKFPIEEIGVAQGNSLSPLLGNVLLHDFDQEMNAGDCRCIRYIDDFIILAPTAKAATARSRLAKKLLAKHGMNLSDEKSSQAPIDVTKKIEFLGVELANGLIRPTKKAQGRLLSAIGKEFDESAKAFSRVSCDRPVPKALGLTATLKRVDGIVQGWGKHYRFCNDSALLERLDKRVDEHISTYLGKYAASRARASDSCRRSLLGIEELGRIKLQPLNWPKVRNASSE